MYVLYYREGLLALIWIGSRYSRAILTHLARAFPGCTANIMVVAVQGPLIMSFVYLGGFICLYNTMKHIPALPGR